MATRIRYRTVYISTQLLDERHATRRLWQESPEEARRAAQWAQDRAWLLAWVRERMAESLTERERHCVEMHYFQDLTFQQAGDRTGTNPSSVYRGVQRALRKLRAAAQADPAWRAHYPLRIRPAHPDPEPDPPPAATARPTPPTPASPTPAPPSAPHSPASASCSPG